jgi:hypothetical protein
MASAMVGYSAARAILPSRISTSVAKYAGGGSIPLPVARPLIRTQTTTPSSPRGGEPHACSSPRSELVGPMPLVVSGGFMPPSILAVILSCLGLAEQFGRVGRLAIGPGGPLVPSGGALMAAPALGALVVVGHSREPSSVVAATAVRTGRH